MSFSIFGQSKLLITLRLHVLWIEFILMLLNLIICCRFLIAMKSVFYSNFMIKYLNLSVQCASLSILTKIKSWPSTSKLTQLLSNQYRQALYRTLMFLKDCSFSSEAPKSAFTGSQSRKRVGFSVYAFWICCLTYNNSDTGCFVRELSFFALFVYFR